MADFENLTIVLRAKKRFPPHFSHLAIPYLVFENSSGADEFCYNLGNWQFRKIKLFSGHSSMEIHFYQDLNPMSGSYFFSTNQIRISDF
jgi:hypothetical protein